MIYSCVQLENTPCSKLQMLPNMLPNMRPSPCPPQKRVQDRHTRKVKGKACTRLSGKVERHPLQWLKLRRNCTACQALVPGHLQCDHLCAAQCLSCIWVSHWSQIMQRYIAREGLEVGAVDIHGTALTECIRLIKGRQRQGCVQKRGRFRERNLCI